MALIEIDDLVVSYGREPALNGVSLRIDEGALGLLGPNGAGKSTLIKTILGFLRPSSGRVKVFDLPLPKSALLVRQRVGYMPERESTSPKISAVSFLTYCGRLFGMSMVDAMERTHEVLNYVGLGESRYRNMETYSTGMLQRVKLAQALIHDPKLLFLDEPTNGLDPDGRIEMLELIREIASHRGVTVILSSHLLPDVQHVCDRVAMLAKGRILSEGSIEALTGMLERQYEVRVRDNDEAYAALLEQAGCAQHRMAPSDTLLVRVPSDMKEDAFFEMARAAGTQIRHFRPARRSLESAFMEALGKDTSDAGV